ncbi:MAG: extracellular solute-binding protein [Firmicutes bacterium]|nr:extracellular solute-binding protein [Bacillota bacterium]
MKRLNMLIGVVIMSLLFANVALANPVDLGGKTITVTGAIDKLEGVRDEGRLAEAEELFNCKIEMLIVPVDVFNETMVTRLISGDSEYDVWAIDNGDSFFPLVGADALLPVNKVLGEDYYAEARKYARPAVDAFSVAGNTYLISSFETLPNGATTWLAFNKDLFEAEGLPDPYELYRNGEWNWDNFHKIALAATKDLDGDGEPDQFGIENLYTWAYLVASNGSNLFVPDETGKLIYNWNSEAVMAAMSFGRQLASIDRVTTTGGFSEGSVLMSFQATWQLDGLKDSGMRYGLIPFPKGPHADDHYFYTGFIGTFGLPANSAEPDKIAAVMDYLFMPEDWEGYIKQNYEDLVNSYAPDIESARILTEWLPRYGQKGEILNYPLAAEEVWNAYSSAMQGEKTPAEAMNAVAAQGQAYVDDLLGQ